jgi:hypothetical protein
MGLYGGASNVGYYCDECWERTVLRRKRAITILVVVGVLLLVLNLLGYLLLKGDLGGSISWSIVAVGVALILVLGLFIAKR